MGKIPKKGEKKKYLFLFSVQKYFNPFPVEDNFNIFLLGNK